MRHNEGCLEHCSEEQVLGERHLLCAACAQLAAERYSFHPSSVCGQGEDGEDSACLLGTLSLAQEQARRNHGKQLGFYKANVTRFAGKV